MSITVELKAPGWQGLGVDGMRITLEKLRARYRLPTTCSGRPGVKVGGAPEDALDLGIRYIQFKLTDRVTYDGLPIYELEVP